MAIAIFSGFVVFLFWLSWYLGRRSSSADSFFVAGGKIHWAVNGIALTGGYLSAASFLGICGMIAFKGFDGYLYSIGFLSGWVVALFVVAEPLRRLGKYTFADALGARFESRQIHLAASISTLVICLCYLVPQMVGAGVLIEPLLGVPHHWGVIIVGAVVIVVVASAGMSSTTYVQFIKAAMLIVFSGVLVAAVCIRGLGTPGTASEDGQGTPPLYEFETLEVRTDIPWEERLRGTPYRFVDAVQGDHDGSSWVLLECLTPLTPGDAEGTYYLDRPGRSITTLRDPDGAIAGLLRDASIPGVDGSGAQSADVLVQAIPCFEQAGRPYARLPGWWLVESREEGGAVLHEAQSVSRSGAGGLVVNGLPESADNALLPMGRITEFGTRTGHHGRQGWIGPLRLLSIFADPGTEVHLPRTSRIDHGDSEVTLYYHTSVGGNELMRPGGHFKLASGSLWSRLDFISLMLALFFGTAALPHVLIRYYTVPDSSAARKSTIVAISAIGLFYILTLFLGLGAIANGVLNPQTDNMSAPLLARAFGEGLFAIITALAFATVLGTVSGLIVAASGAVANDFLDRYLGVSMPGNSKVVVAKLTAVGVGVVSVVLGILFRGVNVGFLVGWAFAVAASANFPAIIMVLFWRKTTAAGIVASILVGIVASLGIILLGPDMFAIYGLGRTAAWIPLGQPAVLSMPLSFLTLVVVSVFTQARDTSPADQGGEPVAVT
jgi:cation/acetate symporter